MDYILPEKVLSYKGLKYFNYPSLVPFLNYINYYGMLDRDFGKVCTKVFIQLPKMPAAIKSVKVPETRRGVWSRHTRTWFLKVQKH